MGVSRYNRLRKLKSENKKLFLELSKDIEIPKQADDIYIRWREVDSLPLLANRFYDDPQYYWVILLANNALIESDLKSGQKIRIPKNVNRVISQL